VAIFPHPPFAAYELLDSGHAEKLERFGRIVLRRPDPQALWRPRLAPEEWRRRADLEFVRESDRGGRWEAARGEVPEEWELEVAVGWTEPACLVIRPTPF
jgi:23S rRNA (cytosine1962-C5)-methyltransferase